MYLVNALMQRRNKPPKRKDVEAAVRRYLDSRHTTLWADWEIASRERRELAVQWATDVFLDIHAELTKQEES